MMANYTEKQTYYAVSKLFVRCELQVYVTMCNCLSDVNYRCICNCLSDVNCIGVCVTVVRCELYRCMCN